jgi:hypothetical protein
VPAVDGLVTNLETRLALVSPDMMKRTLMLPLDCLYEIVGRETPSLTRHLPLKLETNGCLVTPRLPKNKGDTGHVCVEYKDQASGKIVTIRLDVVFYALFMSETDLAETPDGWNLDRFCGDIQCMSPEHLQHVPHTKKAKADHARYLEARLESQARKDEAEEINVDDDPGQDSEPEALLQRSQVDSQIQVHDHNWGYTPPAVPAVHQSQSQHSQAESPSAVASQGIEHDEIPVRYGKYRVLSQNSVTGYSRVMRTSDAVAGPSGSSSSKGGQESHYSRAGWLSQLDGEPSKQLDQAMFDSSTPKFPRLFAIFIVTWCEWETTAAYKLSTYFYSLP